MNSLADRGGETNMSPLVVIGLIPFLPLSIQLVLILGRGQVSLRGGSVIRWDENSRRYWAIVATHIPVLTVSLVLIYLGFFGGRPP